ncbi:MAG: hypothetical protein ACXADX_17470 [Candidatus Hodarchaeales archaeon]
MLEDDSRTKGALVTPKVSAALLDDLLNIEAVVVILRKQSLSLYDSWLGFHSIDAQLFSGLVSAITAMINELGGTTVRDRHSFLEFSQAAGDEDLIVWAALGKLVAIALILKRRSSRDLRRILASLIYAYESELEEDLLQFTGYLTDIYDKSEKIIHRELHFEFLSPVRLVKDPEDCPPICQSVARIINEEQRALAESEGLYIRELVSVAVRSLGTIPYMDILNQILHLVANGLLVPTEEAVKLSKVDSAIEAIEEVLAEDEEELISEDVSLPSSAEESMIVTDSAKSVSKEALEALSQEIAEVTALQKQVEESKPAIDAQAVSEDKEFPKDAELLSRVQEILNSQETPDIPIQLAKDVLERELIYSGAKGAPLTIQTSEVGLDQVESFVKGNLIGEIKRNAFDGPLFDTRIETLTLRISIAKIDQNDAICLESLLSIAEKGD